MCLVGLYIRTVLYVSPSKDWIVEKCCIRKTGEPGQGLYQVPKQLLTRETVLSSSQIKANLRARYGTFCNLCAHVLVLLGPEWTGCSLAVGSTLGRLQ